MLSFKDLLTGWIILLLIINAESKRGSRGRSGARSSAAISRHTRKPFYTRKFSKPGSIEHTSNFRSFLFGATSGYLIYNDAGKHLVQDASTPILFGSRKYYWGENNYKPNEQLPIQCINKIDPHDPQFGRVYYSDDSKPQEIVYGCPASSNCCGYDCCSSSTFFTSIFSLLILLLVVSVFGIFVVECVRWCLHCTYFCKHGRQRDFEPLSI